MPCCQQYRCGTFSHLMLGMLFWNEMSGELEGRKTNVGTDFGIRRQVYSLNKLLFGLEIRVFLNSLLRIIRLKFSYLKKKQIGF